MDINVETFYEEIGVRIKVARIKADIKPDTLGDILGLTRTSIVNIENGRQRPSVHLLLTIAKIFRISFNELLPEFCLEHSIEDHKVHVHKKDIQSISKVDNETEQSLKEFMLSIK